MSHLKTNDNFLPQDFCHLALNLPENDFDKIKNISPNFDKFCQKPILKKITSFNKSKSDFESSFDYFYKTQNNLNYPAGTIPRAAIESKTINCPAAWLIPCHWQMNLHSAQIILPQNLQISDNHINEIFTAAADFLKEDKIIIEKFSKYKWLAKSEINSNENPEDNIFINLKSQSPAYASLGEISLENLPQYYPANDKKQKKLELLQNELQMLLYNLKANDERMENRLLPINALLVSGAGIIDKIPALSNTIYFSNAPAIYTGDKLAEKWKQLDDIYFAKLLENTAHKKPAKLTLCTPDNIIEFKKPTGIIETLKSFF